MNYLYSPFPRIWRRCCCCFAKFCGKICKPLNAVSLAKFRLTPKQIRINWGNKLWHLWHFWFISFGLETSSLFFNDEIRILVGIWNFPNGILIRSLWIWAAKSELIQIQTVESLGIFKITLSSEKFLVITRVRLRGQIKQGRGICSKAKALIQ